MCIVSIITPVYNASQYIGEMICSVLGQTYSNWELILVDDCSTDSSGKIINDFVHKDKRIKYVRLLENSGSATVPRNVGTEMAKGNIIAFLDSDDIWYPQKLEKQIDLLRENIETAIVFADYEYIDSCGKRLKRIVSAPHIVNYSSLLKTNSIGLLTGIYNVDKLGKRYFINVGHEDYVFWLSILREGYQAVNVGSCLAAYRILEQSLSSNKSKAAGWQWNIYRNVERLNYIQSLYYFSLYFINAIKKHFL